MKRRREAVSGPPRSVSHLDVKHPAAQTTTSMLLLLEEMLSVRPLPPFVRCASRGCGRCARAPALHYYRFALTSCVLTDGCLVQPSIAHIKETGTDPLPTGALNRPFMLCTAELTSFLLRKVAASRVRIHEHVHCDMLESFALTLLLELRISSFVHLLTSTTQHLQVL